MDRATMMEVYKVIAGLRGIYAQRSNALQGGVPKTISNEQSFGAVVALDELKLELDKLEAEYLELMAREYNRS